MGGRLLQVANSQKARRERPAPAGQSRRAFRALMHMVEQGATTMWDRWRGSTTRPCHDSFNHDSEGAVWTTCTASWPVSRPPPPR
ncbi:hypothetical protein ABT116_36525 [Streptomyces sp. NPDC002130]|uniref:alpha-L-rhamnosidase-related protein n=1 Tax=Streptomyces sp. NPDC002130 TaxID=3155568 RepID=UPI0033210652